MPGKEDRMHELANLFPMSGAEEFQALCDDIAKNGLLEPFTIGDGKILDGRSRAKACGMLGVETKTTEFSGNDPLGFVLSKNVRRRHLSKSQLAMTAVKLANIADEEDEL